MNRDSLGEHVPSHLQKYRMSLKKCKAEMNQQGFDIESDNTKEKNIDLMLTAPKSLTTAFSLSQKTLIKRNSFPARNHDKAAKPTIIFSLSS
ncbi:hypothetical protein SCA6_000871 [Theobroma cacao]